MNLKQFSDKHYTFVGIPRCFRTAKTKNGEKHVLLVTDIIEECTGTYVGHQWFLQVMFKQFHIRFNKPIRFSATAKQIIKGKWGKGNSKLRAAWKLHDIKRPS